LKTGPAGASDRHGQEIGPAPRCRPAEPRGGGQARLEGRRV